MCLCFCLLFFRNCDFWLDVIRSARQEIAAAKVGVDVGFTVKVDYMDIHCFARIRNLSAKELS